jgi:hypothetical protein
MKIDASLTGPVIPGLAAGVIYLNHCLGDWSLGSRFDHRRDRSGRDCGRHWVHLSLDLQAQGGGSTQVGRLTVVVLLVLAVNQMLTARRTAGPQSGLPFGARRSQGPCARHARRTSLARDPTRVPTPAVGKTALRCRRASASANKRSQRLTMVKESRSGGRLCGNVPGQEPARAGSTPPSPTDRG